MPSKDKATRQAADLCAKVLTNLEPDAPVEAEAEADVEGKVQPASTAQ
jgi:hypothetical protein